MVRQLAFLLGVLVVTEQEYQQSEGFGPTNHSRCPGCDNSLDNAVIWCHPHLRHCANCKLAFLPHRHEPTSEAGDRPNVLSLSGQVLGLYFHVERNPVTAKALQIALDYYTQPLDAPDGPGYWWMHLPGQPPTEWTFVEITKDDNQALSLAYRLGMRIVIEPAAQPDSLWLRATPPFPRVVQEKHAELLGLTAEQA